MENLNTDVQKMIEELNQYILPSTLMECFDAWREEAYKQAIRSIPKSSLGWFLDMLNRFRGPEDRKELLLEVFDPSMFTQRRTFQNREAVIRYLALNASPRMEDLWVTDDREWLEAPRSCFCRKIDIAPLQCE
jgi:hypothetical protein